MKVNVLREYLTDKKPKCSKDKLNQVWINLLNNALQAMSYVGTLEIKIQFIEPWIKVSITDSGTGISDSIKSKIFDPFFTTKPGGEGMGLGLDICKKIILQMGGKIELEDVPKGACFSVWLPAA